MTKKLKAMIWAILMAFGLQAAPAGATSINFSTTWYAGDGMTTNPATIAECTLGWPLYFQSGGVRYWYWGSSASCEYTNYPSMQGGYIRRDPLTNFNNNVNNYDAIGGWIQPADYTLHNTGLTSVGKPPGPMPLNMAVKSYCDPSFVINNGSCWMNSQGYSGPGGQIIPVTGTTNVNPGARFCYSGDYISGCSTTWYWSNAHQSYVIDFSFGTNRGAMGGPLYQYYNDGQWKAYAIGTLGRCVTFVGSFCVSWTMDFMSEITSHLSTGWQY